MCRRDDPFPVDERSSTEVFKLRSVASELHRHQPRPLARLRRLTAYDPLHHFRVAVKGHVMRMVAASTTVDRNRKCWPGGRDCCVKKKEQEQRCQTAFVNTVYTTSWYLNNGFKCRYIPQKCFGDLEFALDELDINTCLWEHQLSFRQSTINTEDKVCQIQIAYKTTTPISTSLSSGWEFPPHKSNSTQNI